MREIKILAIVVVIVGVLYWGVEPLAHSVFHPKAAPSDFAFQDLERVDLSKADAQRGKELVETNCAICHNIKAIGIDNGVVSFPGGKGEITTPDLSTAGALYDENFLATLIVNPVKATKLGHKFSDENPFPMTSYEGDKQDVADMVAFLKSIGATSLKHNVLYSDEYTAKKEALEKSALSDSQKEAALANLETQLTNKAVFVDACSRCHSIKYDEPKTKEKLEANEAKRKNIQGYLGAEAPDLSMMIRSKGEHYLEGFINDPQKVSYNAIKQAIIAKQGSLPENTTKSDWQEADDYSNLAKELGVMPNGLSMPRVGLTEESQERVIAYLESIGDSKKHERESLGVYVIIFFGILSVLAFLWKRKIWRELH